MEVALNTLFVTTPDAYVHLDNETLRVEVERQTRLRVPLQHIGAVVCFGNVLVSPALAGVLADSGKALVILDRNGRFKARMEGPVSGNVLLRMAQYDAYKDPLRSLELARAFVAGKLQNSRNLVLRAAREATDEVETQKLSQVANHLANRLKVLPNAQDHDTLRGQEGEAARQYFDVFSYVIKPTQRPDFLLNNRSRRPPLDRTNALLSFLYSLLMNDCRSALEAVGLDPQIGFLHALRPGRAALALDLMEEFRPLLADRLALTLINRAQIQADDFDMQPGGAVLLAPEARKAILIAYQERKQESIYHPLADRSIMLGLIPHLQARLLARVVRGDADGYLPFIPK